jgi:hypothetical protein
MDERRGTGVTVALVVATGLALVPWLGLLLDATESNGSPAGTTQEDCASAWCFDFSHVVLHGTVGIAAVCAGVAAAMALVVLGLRRARVWPVVVIALAGVAMVLYGILI